MENAYIFLTSPSLPLVRNKFGFKDESVNAVTQTSFYTSNYLTSNGFVIPFPNALN